MASTIPMITAAAAMTAGLPAAARSPMRATLTPGSSAKVDGR